MVKTITGVSMLAAAILFGLGLVIPGTTQTESGFFYWFSWTILWVAVFIGLVYLYLAWKDRA